MWGEEGESDGGDGADKLRRGVRLRETGKRAGEEGSLSG